MSAEIVVEADDYRFTTDAWAAYTGRQIIAAAVAVAGAGLLVVGFIWGLDYLSDIIVATPDGVLFVRENASPGGLLFCPFVSAFGVVGLHFVPLLWPWPERYGERIEEADPR